MALQRFRTRIPKDQHERRLDHFLSEWLPNVVDHAWSRAQARKLILAGAVYLNGKRIRIASKPVFEGAQIEVVLDQNRLKDESPSRDVEFQMTPDRILFEDEDLIIVNKPAGMATQPTLDESRANLFHLLKKFISDRDRIADAYLGLHHRLDRDTSGIILFTKTKRANPGVAKLFAEKRIQKTYRALTVPPPVGKPVAGEWAIKNYLRKQTLPGKRSRMTAARSGGDFAHTDFRVVVSFSDKLLIEALPRTGRMHQIRTHLADSGIPILGDALYGGPPVNESCPRIMLHAFRLEFAHPVTQQEMKIDCPVPEDFSRCLGRK